MDTRDDVATEIQIASRHTAGPAQRALSPGVIPTPTPIWLERWIGPSAGITSLLGPIAAVVVLWRVPIGVTELALLIAMSVLTGFGIGVSYRRLFSHRSFLPPCISPARARLFAHSRRDALLVLVSLIETALLVTGVVAAEPVWAWLGPVGAIAVLSGLGLLLVFLNCTNYQCVAHNFLHNPFFAPRSLNRVFGVVNTLALGVPQCLYRVHHLNHHRHGNDRVDPATGTTRDRSSTFRFGREGREEPLFSYALLGPFRTEFGLLWAAARRRPGTGQVAAELSAWGLFLLVLGLLNLKGLVAFYLPVWYLGQAMAHAENWFEHHGAIPGDRRTDSVSSYGWLYNVIWFDNGYHQEHHWRPQVHWTKVRELRAEMLPEDCRTVVPWAHWVNL